MMKHTLLSTAVKIASTLVCATYLSTAGAENDYPHVAASASFQNSTAINPGVLSGGDLAPVTGYGFVPDMMPSPSLAHQPDTLLVRFAPNIDHNTMAATSQRITGATNIRALQTATSLGALSQGAALERMKRWCVVGLPAGSDLAQARQRLVADPQIDHVEYNYRVTVNRSPNDTLYHDMWSLQNHGQSGGKPGADINAPQAWDMHTGSRDVVVAVIDTGVDYTHPDLAANLWTNPGEVPDNGVDDDNNGFIDDVYGYNFVNNTGDPRDDHGHGTHVAGTVAAEGNNDLGVVGVAWQARVMALKFLDASGGGWTSDAVEAVLYASQMGAKLSNNSWGGSGFSTALRDAIAAADEAGSLFVASAGNSGRNSDTAPSYPAAYDLDNIISVAATDHNDKRAYFSNYGAKSVDLGAPGVNILSTMTTRGARCCTAPSGYGVLNGTSMASPHVAGAAALVFSAFPNLNHRQVKNRLLDSVDPVPALEGRTVTGGRLNVAKALGDADYVDLSPTSLVGTQRVVPGGVIRATDTICSLGDRHPGLSYAALYVSPDKEITTDDIRIGTHSTRISNANADGCVSGDYWGFLPLHEHGLYYLGAIADYRDDVAEGDETNNTSASIMLTVTEGQADLVVKSLQGPGEATLGGSISVSSNFCNEGIRASGDFTYGLYLSTDTEINASDENIGSGDSILYNEHCNHPNTSLSGKIPAHLADNDAYYLGIILDTENVVPEDIETNNSLAGNRIVLNAPRVDLVVTAFNGPDDANLGERVSLSGTLCNKEGGALPFQFGTVYLSDDAIISADDRAVGSQFSLGSADQCTDGLSGSATIPVNLPTGDYYWGIIADTLQSVPESNENNNHYTGNRVHISAP